MGLESQSWRSEGAEQKQRGEASESGNAPSPSTREEVHTRGDLSEKTAVPGDDLRVSLEERLQMRVEGQGD